MQGSYTEKFTVLTPAEDKEFLEYPYNHVSTFLKRNNVFGKIS